MDIGIFDGGASDGVPIDDLVASARRAQEDGFASWWSSQIFGYEALSILAVIGREVPGITLGTGVVPTYPRHPITMAQLALTAHVASRGRLVLGIGLSHQIVIENMFGMSFDAPAGHMSDYLDALMPLLADHSVSFTGSRLSASVGLNVPDIPRPPVLVAALGPKMLALAGQKADGTITWMTGPKTLSEHIVPSITRAAEAAGRPAPRIAASLPVVVTDDPDGARARCAKVFEMYGYLPSYRAMLDREGAEGPADVAIVGDEETVATGIGALAEAGVTDFAAAEAGRPGEEADRTRALLKSLV
jgi:F420-dependent oxidoreductase-like protein